MPPRMRASGERGGAGLGAEGPADTDRGAGAGGACAGRDAGVRLATVVSTQGGSRLTRGGAAAVPPPAAPVWVVPSSPAETCALEAWCAVAGGVLVVWGTVDGGGRCACCRSCSCCCCCSCCRCACTNSAWVRGSDGGTRGIAALDGAAGLMGIPKWA